MEALFSTQRNLRSGLRMVRGQSKSYLLLGKSELRNGIVGLYLKQTNNNKKKKNQKKKQKTNKPKNFNIAFMKNGRVIV